MMQRIFGAVAFIAVAAIFYGLGKWAVMMLFG